MDYKSEDIVRDEAREILGLKNSEDVLSNVGQLTTFNRLGFDKTKDRPDGWYLPNNVNEVAIILETKNSEESVYEEKWINELKKNIKITNTKYKRVIGILYNGYDVLVFKNNELAITSDKLFNKSYYLKLYNINTVDKNLIYNLTKKINDNLHYNFGIDNLNHRMVFTACALVAKRYGAVLVKEMNWNTLHSSILSTLENSYEEAKIKNTKLDILSDEYKTIRFNYTENQTAINDFIECVTKISDNINSDYWNGEDVMGIFFNEFTRYKGKSEQGQVFTPDHITSFMYRITGTSYKDKVLDACCGSGAFLTKAMSNMIQEVGGVNNETEVQKIKEEHLYGVEFNKSIFALACANMLIHKDGKTNIIQEDSKGKKVSNWIKSNNITKVLMNPPYEKKCGCLKIVENVLENVDNGAICAFILPDTKLKVNKNIVIKWLTKHTLQKIIKLPDVFSGMANVRTSIFIFKAHEPQIIQTVENNQRVLKSKKDIFSCWIQDDGLETVKNQGRHDVNNVWKAKEDYWVDVIYKQSGDETIQWLNPLEHLSYQISKPDFIISNKDINKVSLNYILFKKNINEDEFDKIVKNYYLYGEDNVLLTDKLLTYLGNNKKIGYIDTTGWKRFKLDIPNFSIGTGAYINKQVFKEGNTPRITVKGKNNGIFAKYTDVENRNYRTFENFISYSFLGTSFYHPYKASLDMKVHAIQTLKYKLNHYSGLFLVLVLLKTFAQDFDDQTSSTDLKESEIYLPAKTINFDDDIYEPDWAKMENYVKPIYDEIEQAFL